MGLSFPNPIDVVKHVANDVVNVATSAADDFNEAMNEAKNVVDGAGDAVVGTVADLKDGIKSAWQEGVGDAADLLMDSPLAPLVTKLAGFEKSPTGDFYVTSQHSIQSYGGFADIYDTAGPALGMDLDEKVVNFTVDGKEYRVELWKGAYGFGGAYGGEIGLYYKNPDSDSWLTQMESKVPGLYATVDSKDQMRMVQELYSKDDPDHPILVNDTADYADDGKHFWNLAIKTDPAIPKENLFQRDTFYVEDPALRDAMVEALGNESGITDISVDGSRVTFTWGE